MTNHLSLSFVGLGRRRRLHRHRHCGVRRSHQIDGNLMASLLWLLLLI